MSGGMMRLLICGPHSSGKTTKLLEELLNDEEFILVDSTYEEKQKSILWKYERFFDKVFDNLNFYLLRYLNEEDKIVGVNLSYPLERFLDTNDFHYFREFKESISQVIKIIKQNNFDKKYLIAFDEIPLSNEDLIAVSNFKRVILIPEDDCEKYKSYFDKIIYQEQIYQRPFY